MELWPHSDSVDFEHVNVLSLFLSYAAGAFHWEHNDVM